MSRVLYLSDACTPHDRRFLAAIAAGGHAVHHLPLLPLERSLERESLLVPYSAGIPSGSPQCTTLAPLSPAFSPRDDQTLDEARRRLQSVLCDLRPDAVVAGPATTCGFLAAWARAHPLLLTLWGWDILVAPGENPKARRMVEYALRRADLILADCQTVKRRCIELARVDDDRFVTLPYGIELQRFEDKSAGRALRRKFGWESHRVLIHTRAFQPTYGVLEFIRAFAEVSHARSDLRAIVIGDGPLRDDVHASHRGLRLEGLVHLPGRVPEADLPAWFHAADIYVSAAHSDGTSISLLEAMAAGLPVITSDAPGNREWVTPNDNGWLHRAGDAADLAETIALALAADTRLMSRANLAQVHRRADWTANAQKLRDAVARLIAHR